MSTLLEPERTRFLAQVVQIVAGDPATLIVKTQAVNCKGVARRFTQHLQVRDAALLARLQQLRAGDEIEVEAVTVFPEGARYYTYLADFTVHEPSAQTPASAEKAPALAAAG